MAQGLITLTNGSAAVSGAGTNFGTDNKIGDFIVGYINGQSYSLAIASIESLTALTLTEVFYGPTTASVPWDSVPLRAITAIPYQLGVQHLNTLRLMNLESDNWLQLYTGTGDITVNIPDGRQYHGPSLLKLGASLDNKADKTALDTYAKKGQNSDITSLSGLTTALSIAQGGTGAKDAGTARTNLGLGSASTKNAGTSSGNLMPVGAFGLGGSIVSQPSWVTPTNETRFIEVPPNSGSPFGGTGGGGISISSGSAAYGVQLMMPLFGDRLTMRSWSPTVFSNGVEFLSTGNTTVDVNGFLKRASPVVKIFGSGTAETNEESEGVVVTRTGPGEYLIEGCMGLNADAGWGGIDGGFEIPVDHNKQPQLWLDYSVNADGSITVKTFHRTHPQAPSFAQNSLEGVNDGDLIDIPADSFVSVRVEMPQNSIFNERQVEAQKAMSIQGKRG